MLVESSPRKPSRHVADTCVPTQVVPVPIPPNVPSVVLFSAHRTSPQRPRYTVLFWPEAQCPEEMSQRLLPTN